MRIMKEQVDYWIGWDNPWQVQKSEMLDVITKIANGEYPPEVLKEDIESLSLNCEETE